MKPLKKAWLKLIINICTIGLLVYCAFFFIGTLESNKQYKRDIEDKDKEVAREKLKVETYKGAIVNLEGEREKDKAAAAEKIRKMKERQKEKLAQISTERDEWREKVQDLPASTVVIKMRTVLKLYPGNKNKNYTNEILERPDGILFSLEAARDCLAILGDFSLKKERDEIRDNYKIAMSAVEDLKRVAKADEEIFSFFRKIGISKDGITEAWTSKFSLSEKRFKASWWRGVKAGVPVGGLIALLFWLALGR